MRETENALSGLEVSVESAVIAQPLASTDVISRLVAPRFRRGKQISMARLSFLISRYVDEVANLGQQGIRNGYKPISFWSESELKIAVWKLIKTLF